jgi:hypothetical protein
MVKIKNKVRLTSVNVLDGVYSKFKEVTVNTDMTLQKLVNRSVDLYNKDEDFKSKIENHQTTDIKNFKY